MIGWATSAPGTPDLAPIIYTLPTTVPEHDHRRIPSELSATKLAQTRGNLPRMRYRAGWLGQRSMERDGLMDYQSTLLSYHHRPERNQQCIATGQLGPGDHLPCRSAITQTSSRPVHVRSLVATNTGIRPPMTTSSISHPSGVQNVSASTRPSNTTQQSGAQLPPMTS